jgi:DNA modification methylase
MRANAKPKAFCRFYKSEGHELYCGDFRVVLAKMPRVDLVLTSPPYNIGSECEKKTGLRALGRYDTKSFGAVRSYPDSLPEADYQATQTRAMKWMSDHVKETGNVVYNHKNRHKNRVLIKPESWFPSALTQTGEVVWDRGSTHNHGKTFLYPTTERLFVFSRQGCEKLAFFQNEGFSDIWRFPPTRGIGTHDATYPLEMARRCIRLWSRPGDTVCDPYSGSGTTMIAAALEGRKFVGAELMEEHFEASERRFQESLREQVIAV